MNGTKKTKSFSEAPRDSAKNFNAEIFGLIAYQNSRSSMRRVDQSFWQRALPTGKSAKSFGCMNFFLPKTLPNALTGNTRFLVFSYQPEALYESFARHNILSRLKRQNRENFARASENLSVFGFFLPNLVGKNPKTEKNTEAHAKISPRGERKAIRLSFSRHAAAKICRQILRELR